MINSQLTERTSIFFLTIMALLLLHMCQLMQSQPLKKDIGFSFEVCDIFSYLYVCDNLIIPFFPLACKRQILLLRVKSSKKNFLACWCTLGVHNFSKFNFTENYERFMRVWSQVGMLGKTDWSPTTKFNNVRLGAVWILVCV